MSKPYSSSPCCLHSLCIGRVNYYIQQSLIALIMKIRKFKNSLIYLKKKQGKKHVVMNQGQCQVWYIFIFNFHIVEQLIFIPILQRRTLKSNNTTCVLLCGLHRWFRGRESTCNAGDMSSIVESGRSPGGGLGNPFQYSSWENPMDRGLKSHNRFQIVLQP